MRYRNYNLIIVNFIIILLCLLLSTGRKINNVLNRDNFSKNVATCSLIRVIDGDTIEVEYKGDIKTIRFSEIDAPESVNPDITKNTKEGEVASNFLKNFLSEGQILYITKDKDDKDKYNRLLRMVWFDKPINDSKDEIKKKCINAIMVKLGFANVKNYSNGNKYHNDFVKIEKERINNEIK